MIIIIIYMIYDILYENNFTLSVIKSRLENIWKDNCINPNIYTKLYFYFLFLFILISSLHVNITHLTLIYMEFFRNPFN